MSQPHTTVYRDSQLPITDSEEENLAIASPQPASSESSPSSANFSSESQNQPSSDQQPLGSDVTLPDLEQVFPSTATQFNFPRSTSDPTTHKLISTKSLPKSDPTVVFSHPLTQPSIQVFRAEPLTSNPARTISHTQQPTNLNMNSAPMQYGIDALPIQGKRDAPRTFKGNYDKVEEFLKTMDRLFSRYRVIKDDEKVEAILPYCSSKVRDFIQASP